MKKIVIAVLTLLLCMTVFSGCAREDKAADSGKISVVATIFPPYDFVREVAGDQVDLTMLLPPGAESHSFEPTPQDILKIQKCDVFIYNGGESDQWVNKVLDSMDTDKIRIVKFIDCVDLVEEEIVEGMEDVEHEEEGVAGDEPADDEDAHGEEAGVHEGEEEDHEHAYDEHVWTSPCNAKRIVQRITDALCGTDPGNAVAWKQNADAYMEKLDQLDSRFQTVVNGAARKTVIFGDRFPFRYFADAYGLTYFAAFPGCATETEASARTVAFLIDKIKAEKIPAVFHIELSNQKMANAIAEATGAKPLQLHSVHNLTKSDFEAGKTYLDFMNANVGVLEEALN